MNLRNIQKQMRRRAGNLRKHPVLRQLSALYLVVLISLALPWQRIDVFGDVSFDYLIGTGKGYVILLLMIGTLWHASGFVPKLTAKNWFHYSYLSLVLVLLIAAEWPTGLEAEIVTPHIGLLLAQLASLTSLVLAIRQWRKLR